MPLVLLVMPDDKQNTPGKMAAIGAAAGVVSTTIMDLIMFAVLGLTDRPLSSLFTLIARSTAAFLDIFGVTVDVGMSTGVVLHYLIGLVFGLFFAIMMIRVSELQERSLATLLLLAVLYTEILSMVLLVPSAVLLGMSRFEVVELFSFAVFLHGLWAIVLGLLLGYIRARGPDLSAGSFAT